MKHRAVRYAVMGYVSEPASIGGLQTVSTLGLIKGASPDRPFEIVNEFVCNRLGGFLLLPIPTAEIVTIDDELYFRSSPSLGEPHPEADEEGLDYVFQENEELAWTAAGAVVFDAWVLNRDRHFGNVIIDYEDAQLGLIDHGHSIFVGKEVDALSRIERLSDEIAIDGDHCLLKYVVEPGHVMQWVERVEAIPDFQIDGICEMAVGLGYDDCFKQRHVDILSGLLKRRKTMVRHLFESDWSRFPGIEQGSLFYDGPAKRPEPQLVALNGLGDKTSEPLDAKELT